MGSQKVLQRLHQLTFCVAQRDVGGQAVKAHHLTQHAPKARIDQVAPLGKHRVERGAAPLQSTVQGVGWHLDRKRHVRRRCGDPQLRKKRDQLRVGALVKDQETRVHSVGDGALGRIQRDIHGVGMATKVVSGLEQTHLRLVFQPVRSR